MLAPAGDWECARAAVANGADAVYFGLPRFNARMRADNFSEDDVPALVSFLHAHGVKAYAALNVLIFPNELDEAIRELDVLNSAGVDAVIIQDVGLAVLSRRMFPALRVHASTQMTITSPEGVEFAASLGVSQVVLSRELSLREMEKFPPGIPLEVFVHGALCVAYSGQCLTSESLGLRSANRGECAQACRMPYTMIVDGREVDLGDKRYLLSPQDLAAIYEIPDLIARGIASFKIEGRLKSPEYVAAVTAAYRKAIDQAMAGQPHQPDIYPLEMTFSRGLFSGWMHGVDHQRLVRADFGKKRGLFLGTISCIYHDGFDLDFAPGASLKPGDGVVVENPPDTNHEQGGRVWEIRGSRLLFQRGSLKTSLLASGQKVWKTDDPALNRKLRKTFEGRITIDRPKRPLNPVFSGRPGQPLQVEALGVTVRSCELLAPARNQSLDEVSLASVFDRLAESPYSLGIIYCQFPEPVFLPRSALADLRRGLLAALAASKHESGLPSSLTQQDVWSELLADIPTSPVATNTRLSVLVRSEEQLRAAITMRVPRIYLDFEDIRRYGDAIRLAADRGLAAWPATPRIQKAGEAGFFKLISKCRPEGVLVRNVGAVDFFRREDIQMAGDFSLNVSNKFSAAVFRKLGIESLTVSYDLNVGQVLDLLASAPPDWFELTIHQHMPMFHMEHCAFAAFLSSGSTFLDCGRPCEKHRVHLRDRVGIAHPLRADVGCRNTLFNATAQTGAAHWEAFRNAGLQLVRVELLEESENQSKDIIAAYASLLSGQTDGSTLWKSLHASSQLGVTRGTLQDRPA
ncbi:MAG: DUF3656 domain-containing protein [Terrimicrobiaceae bacterium]